MSIQQFTGKYRRGTNEDGVYDAQYAQKQYEISMNNRGRKERIFDKNGEMYKFLRQKLIDECVSPQTALDELKKSGIKQMNSIHQKPRCTG